MKTQEERSLQGLDWHPEDIFTIFRKQSVIELELMSFVNECQLVLLWFAQGAGVTSTGQPSKGKRCEWGSTDTKRERIWPVVQGRLLPPLS
jgi:hypothetical protein